MLNEDLKCSSPFLLDYVAVFIYFEISCVGFFLVLVTQGEFPFILYDERKYKCSSPRKEVYTVAPCNHPRAVGSRIPEMSRNKNENLKSIMPLLCMYLS
jgi:hypothetical protein